VLGLGVGVGVEVGQVELEGIFSERKRWIVVTTHI
jgi:hypothetical protein